VTRTLACLLASFVVGALAFPGEEGEADALRQRIRDLTAELRRRADARPEPPALVERRYDVADLLLPIRDDALPRDLDLRGSGPPHDAPEDDGDAAPAFEPDVLFEIVHGALDWERWRDCPGAALDLQRDALVARTTPREHARLAMVLDRVRASANRQLRIEIAAVRVPERERATVLESELTLDDDLARRLRDAATLGKLDVRCREGQRVCRRAGRTVAYLFDESPQIAEAARIGDPVPAGVFEGCHATLRAFLDDAGGGARIEWRLDRNEVQRPIRRIATEHGPIDLPTLAVTRVRTALWAPLGRTVVAGGSMDCLFLVRVHRVGP